MYEPKVGDVVNVTANGVRVINTYGTSVKPVDGPTQDTGTVLVYRHPDWTPRDGSHTVNMGAEGVTVDKVDEHWPPQAGDVWTDHDGDEWFAHRRNTVDLIMTCVAAGLTPRSPEELRNDFPALTLSYRRGLDTAGEEEPAAEPAETEMWTFAVHVPLGVAEQVQRAIETVPGAEVYRAYVNGLNHVVLPSGAVPARQGCPDHMPKPYALCLACHTGQDGDQ